MAKKLTVHLEDEACELLEELAETVNCHPKEIVGDALSFYKGVIELYQGSMRLYAKQGNVFFETDFEGKLGEYISKLEEKRRKELN